MSKPRSNLRETWGRVIEVASRYGLSTFGLTCISAAHFLVSLVFLQAFPPRNFGLVSFVFVLLPLCLSCSGALLGTTVATAAARSQSLGSGEIDALLKSNAVLSVGAAAIVAALMLASGGEVASTLLLALYAGTMTLRWFGRSYTYAARRRVAVTVSDLAYSGLLAGSIGLLWISGALTMTVAALALALSAFAALVPLSSDFLWRQWRSLFSASLHHYGPIWRDLTRWSLLGVVSTEITANAHAYLVNLISGANAFALLAAGALFMRPASLLLSALPDLERPVMARAFAEGDAARAWRCATEMRFATVAMLIVSSVIAIVLVAWWPRFLLHRNYDAHSVLVVVILWAAITAVRTMRAPESVLLQAAAEFKVLAAASLRSSVVSVVATLVLLLWLGPIASLGGVFLGDVVLTLIILSDARRLTSESVEVVRGSLRTT